MHIVVFLVLLRSALLCVGVLYASLCLATGTSSTCFHFVLPTLSIRSLWLFKQSQRSTVWLPWAWQQERQAACFRFVLPTLNINFSWSSWLFKLCLLHLTWHHYACLEHMWSTLYRMTAVKITDNIIASWWFHNRYIRLEALVHNVVISLCQLVPGTLPCMYLCVVMHSLQEQKLIFILIVDNSNADCSQGTKLIYTNIIFILILDNGRWLLSSQDSLYFNPVDFYTKSWVDAIIALAERVLLQSSA